MRPNDEVFGEAATRARVAGPEAAELLRLILPTSEAEPGFAAGELQKLLQKLL